MFMRWEKYKAKESLPCPQSTTETSIKHFGIFCEYIVCLYKSSIG